MSPTTTQTAAAKQAAATRRSAAPARRSAAAKRGRRRPARLNQARPSSRSQDAAERAVLIPVGAALTATRPRRDTVTDGRASLPHAATPPSVASARPASASSVAAPPPATASSGSSRRHRTRVERELRQRRTRQVQREVKRQPRRRASSAAGAGRPRLGQVETPSDGRHRGPGARRRASPSSHFPPPATERRRAGQSCAGLISSPADAAPSPPSTVGAPSGAPSVFKGRGRRTASC